MLLLQECFRKLDGVNVGAHELFTPSELLGGLRCPGVIVNRKWKGQSKIVGGAARWTSVELDGQLTLISAHLLHKLGEFEAALMEIQEFVNGRSKQHVILGGRNIPLLDQQRVQTHRDREREAGGDVGKPQSSERNLESCFEEIKILREDLLREGESVDKSRSHIMTLESTEEIPNLEQQELNLWRGCFEETCWMDTRRIDGGDCRSVEAERISREVEAKKRKLQEAIEKESTMKDVTMADECLDGLDGSLSLSR